MSKFKDDKFPFQKLGDEILKKWSVCLEDKDINDTIIIQHFW